MLAAIWLLLSFICLRLISSPAWAEDGRKSGLTLSPTSLAFSYQKGSTVPPSQSLSVTNSGTISFTDSASGGSWLSLGSTSGTTPGSIGVSVRPGTLAVGTYAGSVLVSSSTNLVTIPI